MNCGTSFSNHKGITNLLSIPLLENLGYKVKIQPDEELVVVTPNGKGIVCKWNTGVAHCMPYIELREQHKGFAMQCKPLEMTLRDSQRSTWNKLSWLARCKL